MHRVPQIPQIPLAASHLLTMLGDMNFKPLPPITCDTRLTIGMPRYLRDALRSAAEAHGQTVTDFARVAIAEHMALTTRPRRPLYRIRVRSR